MSEGYIELLRDPRWQRKRLEVMQRDGFECLSCGDKGKTLHVHHRSYARGRKPWEYDDDNFETVCVDCHERKTQLRRRLTDAIGMLDESWELEVLGYAEGLAALQCAKMIELCGWEHAIGIARAWDLGRYMTDEDRKQFRDDEADLLISFAKDGKVSAATREKIVRRYVTWWTGKYSK